MPIKDFSGNTFVAFTDISGFKEMMKSEIRTEFVLDHFYQTGYDSLLNNNDVNGVFISDCGILFVRKKELNPKDNLITLLEVIQGINKRLLEDEIMLTTSIAYGKFKYEKLRVYTGIIKNPIYGWAYVTAFLDNEIGKPKIQPGQCRIVSKNLEKFNLSSEINNSNTNDNYLNRIIKNKNHYYFYWMVENRVEIKSFQKRYSDAYKLKYKGMIDALKKRNE